MMHVPVFESAVSKVPCEIGRVGENLAAFYLGRLGFDASIVDRRGSDIWCQAPSGTLFSVEVKTTTKPFTNRPNGYSYESYAFRIQNKKADQFILVSLDTNLCRVFSKEMLDARWSSSRVVLRSDEFTLDDMSVDFATLAKSYQ